MREHGSEIYRCAGKGAFAVGQIKLRIGKEIVRSRIIFIIFGRITRIAESLFQVARADILGEFVGLAIVYAREAAAEICIVLSCDPFINIERTTVMAKHGIPFRSKHDVCLPCAPYAAKLFNCTPVLYHCHQTGHAVVCGAVHEFIYNIRFRQTVMRKRNGFIIYHDRYGTLIFQALVNPLIGKLAAIHSLAGFFLNRGVGLIIGKIIVIRLLGVIKIGVGRDNDFRSTVIRTGICVFFAASCHETCCHGYTKEQGNCLFVDSFSHNVSSFHVSSLCCERESQRLCMPPHAGL